MKEALFNFFAWCAGADRGVLDRCGRSEHIKHAGYGGLVLIPPVLGFVSMLYAISTLTDNPWVYTSAALIWAAIVFTFDRFIVSTFRKSGSVWKDMFSVIFMTRMVFAIGIGIIVSHPLVMLVFDDSLEQEMTNMRIESEEAIRTQYDARIEAVRGRQDGLYSDVNEQVAYRQCLERLLLFEMSGKDTTLQCGTTSGLQQYGPRAREIKSEIESLQLDIESLRAQDEGSLQQNQVELAQLIGERDKKLAEFKFSTNYLAREIALTRLEQSEIGGDIVLYTKWFLILFFILVDILPITFKGITKAGEYDRRLALEDGFEIKLTNAHERTQAEMIQKTYVDALTDIRIQRIEEEVANWDGNNFADLEEQLGQYVQQ